MASNSFKVKNSLVLTPKDLSTLTNPEAGDLACDINDNNKIKRYDETLADWVEVGSGAGGGLDVFHTDDFDDIKNTSSFSTGNNASFLGGGTLAGGLSLESVSPISGINSLKYTQASGSLNDYFASEIIDVDLKQQSNISSMTFYFTYDGDANDGRFIVWDETNDQEIASEVSFVETALKATRYSISFVVPPSCTQIRWGYQVLVENVGAVLLVDDVEMSSDPFVITELFAADSSIRVDTANGYGSFGTKIRRFSNERDNIGNDIQYVPSAIDGDSFVVQSAGIYNISYSDEFNAADVMGLSKNASSLTTNLTSLPATERLIIASTAGVNFVENISWEGYLVAGDIIRPHTNGSASGTSSGTGSSFASFTISKVGKNSESILTPSDTFSTDTAPLTYAPSSQYTLSTLENAPVGTFITFTRPANNQYSKTQTTVAPAQSVHDMNQNGVKIFARAYNQASTASEPSVIAIQIGKGLKGYLINAYGGANKTIQIPYDFSVVNSGSIMGIERSYDEKTGVLYLDFGGAILNTNNSRFIYDPNTSTSFLSAYLTVNAGKTLPLLAIPTPKVAYLKDVKPSGTAGGTFTSGAWQTRTLNTVEGDGGFVSLNANQFTLQPGRYEIEAIAPAYQVGGHKCKLRNITDSSDAIIGSSEFMGSASGAQTISKLVGTIVLTSSKTFELQHRAGGTSGTFGLGVNSSLGVSEVYSQVKITKLS